MKIFLTGATGFIGSYIGDAAVEAGHELICLKRKTSDLRRCAAFFGKAKWIDLESDWKERVIAEQPEVLIHAAWTGVTAAERDNGQIQAGNVEFFSELLPGIVQAARIKRFIALGSVAEYGQISGRVDEDHPCNPVSVYGHSKFACMKMLRAFGARFALSHAWLRLFSTYGLGEGETWFMPSILKQMRAGQAPKLTPGEQRYD